MRFTLREGAGKVALGALFGAAVMGLGAYMVSKEIASNEFARGFLAAELSEALTQEKREYVGERDKNGCFFLPRKEEHQDLIDGFRFTEAELKMSFSELFCHGGLIPYNW